MKTFDVRTLQTADLDGVKRLHDKMKTGYSFPDIKGPLFAIKGVVKDENGKIIAAAAVKITSEAFLWLDLGKKEAEKVMAILALTNKLSADAKKIGLDEVTCWIPPQVEGRFAKFLSKLGFQRSPWSSWSLLL